MNYLIYYIAISVLCLCLIMSLWRLVKGPDLPDRVIALDLFAANLLGIVAIYSILAGVEEYLDIALVLSMVAFIGTMIFAYYLIRRNSTY